MRHIEPAFFSRQVTLAKRFYIHRFALHSLGLNVVSGGFEQTAKDFVVDRRNFPYYAVEFVSKGRGTLLLSDQTYELSPGVVFSYGPDIAHRIVSDPQSPMLKYFIAFTGNLASKLLEQYVGPPGTLVRIGQISEFNRIMDDLITHGLSESRLKSKLCSSLLQYLMLRIADSVVIEDAMPGQACLNYQRCRLYIKNHYMDFFSLEDISEACTVDPAYLCRLFKRFDTQSPYQYLIHLKMSHAAQLLHKPGAFVKQIAYELGFKDASHFSRTFKKVFGISPETFRNLR